jgi:RNA polymerase sigma-70 factor (ECF subfamily)
MTGDANRGTDDGARSRDDNGPSDGSLIREFRHGDQDAARLLYQRYAGRLRALARSRCSPDLAGRVDDDDIVQSVFGSFFRGVNNGSYDVPAGEELWNLFLVITVNKVRAKGAHHRAAKRDVRQTAGGEGIDQAPDVLASEGQACAFLRMSVEEALGRLPREQEKAVRLRMEGYEVAEIAETLGRSKRTVERLLQEGRARLGELLTDTDGG